MAKTKSIALILGVLIMSFLVGYLVFAAVWQEPTAIPPGDNRPAPINVGSSQQWKIGEIGTGCTAPCTISPFTISSGGIAATAFYDRDDSAWLIDPTGNAYIKGNVGIGTTGPNEQLEITGNFRLPSSTATTGIIYSGPNRFIHNYGALSNFFAGVDAGNLTTITGSKLTGVGSYALRSNTTGNYNSAMGSYALCLNTTGSYNSAIGGLYTLYSNTTGSYNSAMGSYALCLNTTGNYNSAIGYQALSSNTGSSNSAMGYNALLSNTTGTANSAIGSYALASNATGSYNSAIGFYALYSTTGSYNSAIGSFAFSSNTGGSYNSTIGYNAGRSNTTGNYNTFLGYNAGYTDGTVTTPTGLSNATAIGYNAQVTASNAFVLGGTGAYAVNVGIGTTTPATKLEVVGGPIKATGGLIIETRTSDPASPVNGQIWLRTDL